MKKWSWGGIVFALLIVGNAIYRVGLKADSAQDVLLFIVILVVVFGIWEGLRRWVGSDGPPAGSSKSSIAASSQTVIGSRAVGGAVVPVTSAALPQCAVCGAPSIGTKFCPECGKLFQPKTACSQCGTQFQSGTKFCPECGTRTG